MIGDLAAYTAWRAAVVVAPARSFGLKQRFRMEMTCLELHQLGLTPESVRHALGAAAESRTVKPTTTTTTAPRYLCGDHRMNLRAAMADVMAEDKETPNDTQTVKNAG
ncbi:MAG: hypothetical protein Q7S40_28575 [Opitutaceae bacterium]|nr:hypothetical protein [Opitutaceae bacterium]